MTDLTINLPAAMANSDDADLMRELIQNAEQRRWRATTRTAFLPRWATRW